MWQKKRPQVSGRCYLDFLVSLISKHFGRFKTIFKQLNVAVLGNEELKKELELKELKDTIMFDVSNCCLRLTLPSVTALLGVVHLIFPPHIFSASVKLGHVTSWIGGASSE